MGIFDSFKNKQSEHSEAKDVQMPEENRIELLKREIREVVNDDRKDWRMPYMELLSEVFNQPVLFFGLSERDFNPENATSTPLISSKDFDGDPALYVFTDIEVATNWMRAYRAVSADVNDTLYGRVGAIHKEPYEFNYVFSLACRLGVKHIMLDESGDHIGLDLKAFILQNKIDMKEVQMLVTKADAQDMLKNDRIPIIRLPRIEAIPISRNV